MIWKRDTEEAVREHGLVFQFAFCGYRVTRPSMSEGLMSRDYESKAWSLNSCDAFDKAIVTAQKECMMHHPLLSPARPVNAACR